MSLNVHNISRMYTMWYGAIARQYDTDRGVESIIPKAVLLGSRIVISCKSSCIGSIETSVATVVY